MMPCRTGKLSINRHRGFALAEAMVSLLVLSVGLLGVVAMQLKALQAAQTGYQRSLVSLAAIDAQERVWKEFVRLRMDNNARGTAACLSSESEIDEVNDEWRGYWQGVRGMQALMSASAEIRLGAEDCEYVFSFIWDDTRVGLAECDEEEQDEEGNCPFEPATNDVQYVVRLPIID